MSPDDADPVGITDIARRLHVQRDTVAHWRLRGDFSLAPRWHVSGRPAWHWPDVLAALGDKARTVSHVPQDRRYKIRAAP